MEKLSEARKNGHRILAVVRGSAVNQDGASNGLTAPNGPSQERVIRQALKNAALTTADVDIVEAHGTATTLGDPIEAQALLATYGKGRSAERPLRLGSFKSNIGHTVAAAGVGGVIKMIQAMRHGVMPKTLHVDEPTPVVDWKSGSVELLTEACPWPELDRPRRAAVSSFGVSGTNAHVILEAAPDSETTGQQAAPGAAAEPVSLPVAPWVLSAKSQQALRGQAGRLASHLEKHGELGPLDVSFSLATTRAALSERALLVAGDRDGYLAQLHALAAGRSGTGIVTGTAGTAGKTVFLFPGQGSQWTGMAVELLDTSPVFASRIDECAQALTEFTDWSLHDVLRGTEGAPDIERVDVVQPVLWAVMVSLSALWRAHGVHPTAVVGHSQGEIAAATVAGILSLQDGARVVALRSQAIGRVLAGLGGMVSVALPADQVRERIEPWQGRIQLAAVNGPSSVVVSGEDGPLEEFLTAAKADGLRARRVPVDYASHSAYVELLRDELGTLLAEVSPRKAEIPLLSTVTGAWVEGPELDAGYWYSNLRRTVELEQATRTLLDQGYSTFIESSPHPVLVTGVQETVDDSPRDALVIGSLRRDEGGLARFWTSAGEAYVRGVAPDWSTVFAGTGARRVDLPSYAFQQERYWYESGGAPIDAAGLGLSATGHPLLGAAVAVAGPAPGDGAVVAAATETLFTSRVSARTHPWLADHTVHGRVVLPASALVELAVRAGDEFGATVLDDLLVTAPNLPAAGGIQLQVSVGAADADGRRSVTIHGRPDEGEVAWSPLAQGRLSVQGPGTSFDLGVWPPRGAVAVDLEGAYKRLAGAGLGYGPAFRGVTAAWRLGADLFAEVRLPDEERMSATEFVLHPALLDAALHSVLLADEASAAREATDWRGVRLYATGASSLRVRLTVADDGVVSAQLADPAGQPVAHIASVGSRPLDADATSGAREHDALFQVSWSPVGFPATGASVHRPVLGVLGDDDGEHADVAAVAKAAETGGPLDAVLVQWRTEPDSDMPGSVRRTTHRALALMQQWLADDRLADIPLVFVTAGAVATGTEDVSDLGAAALWGLLRSAQSENPGRIVLIDTDGSPQSQAALPAVLALGEEQSAVREGKAFRPRLQRVSGTAGAYPAASWNPEGTVLITGGTGGLGALFARHLAGRHRVKHLLLTSRRGQQADRANELARELTALGARVTIAAADASDRDALARTIDSIPAEHPLTGVVHLAGVLDDGLIAAQTPERLDAVLRPKADAAWHLHELTRDLDLSAFVLFSSLAGVIGGAGQSNYAAANAFLDGLAQHRAARGLPAVSVAWGLWAQTGGMTGNLDEGDLQRIARAGFRPVTPDQGVAMLDAALAQGRPALVGTPLDVAALRETPERAPLLLTGLARTPVRRVALGAATVTGSPARALLGLTDAQQHAYVLDVVRAEVAAVLGHPDPGGIGADQAFPGLGFDSLTAVELRNRLTTLAGIRLPATLVFDHPTPAALAGHLRTVLLATLGDAGTGRGQGQGAGPSAGASAGGAATPGVDFATEIVLPEDVRPADEVARSVSDPSEVFLTGATGFLGAFLLRDLLRSSTARIRVLVRGADRADALARLRANLEWYRLWNEVDQDRIDVVVGDLAQPRLGLDEEEFDTLSRTVDVVYHPGASVNWIHPYQELKAANVSGTVEILRLAARHRTVPVHYVSTTGVFSGTHGGGGDALKPTEPTGPGEALPTGYVQSKWVSEQIIDIARERGLPVSVFRVDVISGDQDNGACQTRDFVWLSLKGILQAGAVPEGMAGPLHLMPVDYVSAAILEISRKEEAAGRTFHLYNPDELTFAEAAEHLRSFGYPLGELPWDAWLERVTSDRDNAMVPLLDAFEMLSANSDGFYPPMDVSDTRAALEGTGVECPPVSKALFAKYVEFFVDAGYFPAP
nr:thioester reductase domain-containing protein [Streptomyces sp. ISL-100]